MKFPNFYHFFFATLPVLFIFTDNMNEVPFLDLFLPLFSSVLIITIFWLILILFLDRKKSALICSLFIFIIILFAYVRGGLVYHELIELRFLASNLILGPIFGGLTIALIIYILKKEFPLKVHQTFDLMSIVIVAFLFSQIGLFLTNDQSFDEAQKLLNVPIFETNQNTPKPNVFLILLDAYSGNMLLKEDFDYDNSKFLDQLRERGFFVKDRSFSNYPNTELSMPSIMNMNYLDFLSELHGEDSNDMRLAQKLWNENKVMQVFDANGYHIFAFEGRQGTSSEMVTETLCTLPFNYNRELIVSLSQFYIPISSIREKINEDRQYDTVNCVLDTTKNFQTNKEPFYMHMHVRLPHQPFVFDAEGNRNYAASEIGQRFDERFKDAYLEQLIFTNSKTIEIIDSIQLRDPSTVIILMSDHAGRFGIDWENPSELDLYRAFNNLFAVSFPGKELSNTDKFSTVNIFRIFFNTYLDSDYELLDDRYIWYSPAKPFLQTDVTNLIKSSGIET
tara:strand:- start:165 stop:1682 length:1518 start_codon:yes stop_codon:yes gene_type:complete